MTLRTQKYVENKIALRRALQTLFLNMLEENFLLFSHRRFVGWLT